MDVYKKRISEKILYIRNLQGITREKLAEKADLSVSYLYQLETGKKSIGLGGLIKVAGVLGVTLDELVSIDEKLSFSREAEILFEELIRDCSQNEFTIIIESVRGLRNILREHRENI